MSMNIWKRPSWSRMLYLPPDCNGNPCQKGLMPPSLSQAMSETEMDAVMAYLAALPDYEQAAAGARKHRIHPAGRPAC